MSLTDLVIPPWVRWGALALAVAGVFGAGAKAGAWWQGRADAATVATSKGEREASRRETAELKANVSTAGARQAEHAVQVAAQQIKTTQEITYDSTSRARALDARLAAGGLRLPASNGGSTCRLPPGASNPGASADPTAQSLSAGPERDPGSIQGGVADAVREDAARDAQQLAELVDAAYRVGCAGVTISTGEWK